MQSNTKIIHTEQRYGHHGSTLLTNEESHPGLNELEDQDLAEYTGGHKAWLPNRPLPLWMNNSTHDKTLKQIV